jgi:type I restriction enzyme S subunit
MQRLFNLCTPKASNIRQGDLAESGKYPCFGATGIAGYRDNYEFENSYVGIIKDGAGVGRTNIYPPKSSLLGTMQYLEPNEGVNPQYLMYLVRSLKLGSTFQGSTIPHIYFKNYKNTPVKEISKEEQTIIANNLTHLDQSIALKEEQLDKLDSLAKSRFNEMFGDSDLTPQLLRWQPIKEVAKVMTGTTPSTSDSENWDGHILWVTPAEMKEDSFYIFDTERKITEKGQQSKSLQLMPVDTVLLSTRAPIGKVGIVGKEMCCNQGFKNFAFNPLYVNPVFAYWLLKMNTVYLQSIGKGTTFKEISKSNIEKVRIPVPEINRQNEFANFVKQIDKSKFIVQQQIDSLQELLDSKMDEYFGQE